ncbi:MAG: PTS sugar transporter subunit IIB [Leptolinea sp.]|jgi:PTS system ascorbate-specific IIB component|nr:PTS sugar transporter subunit IIB [Leptolinea sp.]
MIRIAAVCGMGLGSGLLVKMGVERVLKRNGFDEREFIVEVGDISTAKSISPDLFVTSTEFGPRLRDAQDIPVIEVHNLFDEKEIETVLIPAYEKIRSMKA